MAQYALARRSRNARLPYPSRFSPSPGILIAFSITLFSCATPPPRPELPVEHPVEQPAATQQPGEQQAPEKPTIEPRPEQPPAEEIPYNRISDAIATGKPEKALEAYESAQGPAAPDLKDQILHARLLVLSGRLGEARAALDRILVDDPADSDALYSLSMVEALEGRDEARKALLEKLVAQEPMHSEALSALGRLALGEGDAKRARAFFEKALSSNPGNAEALSGLGALLLDEKDYAEAEKALSKAVAAEPADPFPYIDRAKAHEALGDREGAIADLSMAIELDPSYPWSFVDRGRLSMQAARFDEALADFTKAIDLDPDQFAARAYRAKILYQEERYAEAKGDFLRLLELNPRYYFSLAPLGVIYYIEGDWAQAARSFLEAYRYDEEELSLPLLAAVAARRGGLTGEANASLQSVVQKAPPDSWPYAVGRYLLSPSADLQLLARIEKEKDRALSARMLFYVAVQYSVEGKQGASLRFFAEMNGMGAPEAIETRLARWELSKE